VGELNSNVRKLQIDFQGIKDHFEFHADDELLFNLRAACSKTDHDSRIRKGLTTDNAEVTDSNSIEIRLCRSKRTVVRYDTFLRTAQRMVRRDPINLRLEEAEDTYGADLTVHFACIGSFSRAVRFKPSDAYKFVYQKGRGLLAGKCLYIVGVQYIHGTRRVLIPGWSSPIVPVDWEGVLFVQDELKYECGDWTVGFSVVKDEGRVAILAELSEARSEDGTPFHMRYAMELKWRKNITQFNSRIPGEYGIGAVWMSYPMVIIRSPVLVRSLIESEYCDIAEQIIG